MRSEAVVAATLAVALACSPRAASDGPCAVVQVAGAATVRIAVGDAPDVRSFALGPGTSRVALPGGRRTRALASAPDAVVWPRSAVLAPGATSTFRAEPLRRVALRGATTDLRVAFVPDRTRAPAGPVARIDALQAWIDVETPRLDRPGADASVALPPDTAWWVVGTSGERTVLAHVPADAVATDVAPAALRAVLREPTVAGRPVPPGALVAPGTLDLAAAAAIRTLVAAGECRGAAIRDDTPWRTALLPDAATLTLWHPRFGLAHADWDVGGPRDATPVPCGVVFRAADGGPFTGHVALWPAWTGSGDVFSRPGDLGLRLGVRSAGRLVFRGLPAGTYRYDHAIARRDCDPGTTLRRGEVRLTRDEPVRCVRIAEPP